MAEQTRLRPALIVLIGLPESGKTATGEIIAESLGWQRGSCSDFIYKLYAAAHGIPEDIARRRNKNTIRQQLIDIGDTVCDVYPEFLAMGAYKQGIQVLDGVRRKVELDALKKAVPNLLVLWVERPDHPSPKDNTSVSLADAHGLVLNNGDLEDLTNTVRDLLGNYDLI